MKKLYTASLIALSSAVLAACSGGSSSSNASNTATTTAAAAAKFEVRVTNLTLAQPLSPVAIILHNQGFNSFQDGEAASVALEMLAEGGSNTDILSEAQAAAQYVTSASTSGPVGPSSIADAVTLTVPSADLTDLRLSVLTMLVRTNDAFTGTNAVNVSNMAVGSSMTFNAPTWDSGTEDNTETTATIPGPGFGGEGFNAARETLNRVRFHQGVVTNTGEEAGLPTSNLTEQHLFDNPTSRIVITRTQ